MNYHILFFKPKTKNSKPEDQFFSIGKTYKSPTPAEALTEWQKEYPKATYLGMYNVDEVSRIKSA